LNPRPALARERDAALSSTATSTGPLNGRGIVITRPKDQAKPLADLLEAAGGRAFLFPAIDIVDLTDRTSLDALLDRLDTFDAAIFISPNAATKGLEAVRARREFPGHVTVLAIGGGTARELAKHGITNASVPPGRYDSESLLDVPALRDVAGKRIVIFRGEGGRALLGETLAERGATIEYAECYRREKAGGDVEALIAAHARGEIDAFVATSSEGLRNLHETLGDSGRRVLSASVLFVPHPRIAETARELALTRIVMTGSGDEAIAAGVVEHFAACV
jgi:uroporphyrinogen-III synthase